MHELHSKVQHTCFRLVFDIEEPMCIADGGIDQPPGETWPSPPTLSWEGIVRHSLIHVVDSAPVGVIVLHRGGDGDRLDLLR